MGRRIRKSLFSAASGQAWIEAAAKPIPSALMVSTPQLQRWPLFLQETLVYWELVPDVLRVAETPLLADQLPAVPHIEDIAE